MRVHFLEGGDKIPASPVRESHKIAKKHAQLLALAIASFALAFGTVGAPIYFGLSLAYFLKSLIVAGGFTGLGTLFAYLAMRVKK